MKYSLEEPKETENKDTNEKNRDDLQLNWWTEMNNWEMMREMKGIRAIDSSEKKISDWIREGKKEE